MQDRGEGQQWHCVSWWEEGAHIRSSASRRCVIWLPHACQASSNTPINTCYQGTGVLGGWEGAAMKVLLLLGMGKRARGKGGRGRTEERVEMGCVEALAAG